MVRLKRLEQINNLLRPNGHLITGVFKEQLDQAKEIIYKNNRSVTKERKRQQKEIAKRYEKNFNKTFMRT